MTFSLILLVIFKSTVLGAVFNGPRTQAGMIAEQLGGGIKRSIYYMDMLLEKCDNIQDFDQWIIFMDSYLQCDTEAHPKKLLASLKEDSLRRLNVLCAAWPTRRKCSSRLALKLNSCLGSQLEDGRAGTNALRLADAHMKFICHNKHAYASKRVIEKSNNDFLAIEKRPLACFREMEEPLLNCVAEGSKVDPQNTFCGNFNLARECLMRTSMQSCKTHEVKKFMLSMLGQLEVDVQCNSANGI